MYGRRPERDIETRKYDSQHPRDIHTPRMFPNEYRDLKGFVTHTPAEVGISPRKRIKAGISQSSAKASREVEYRNERGNLLSEVPAREAV